MFLVVDEDNRLVGVYPGEESAREDLEETDRLVYATNELLMGGHLCFYLTCNDEFDL